jgi:hypothetical protein
MNPFLKRAKQPLGDRVLAIHAEPKLARVMLSCVVAIERSKLMTDRSLVGERVKRHYAILLGREDL